MKIAVAADFGRFDSVAGFDYQAVAVAAGSAPHAAVVALVAVGSDHFAAADFADQTVAVAGFETVAVVDFAVAIETVAAALEHRKPHWLELLPAPKRLEK